MEASACQFVGHRFDRDDAVAFALFALIKFFRRFAIANSKVSRFDVGPSQIAVTIFCIASAFLFAVGDVTAAHTTTVGRIIADVSEAINIARFKQDDRCQNRADTSDGLD